jgi:hypothetical protein
LNGLMTAITSFMGCPPRQPRRLPLAHNIGAASKD